MDRMTTRGHQGPNNYQNPIALRRTRAKLEFRPESLSLREFVFGTGELYYCQGPSPLGTQYLVVLKATLQI